jgi:hypothetical protein
MRIPDYPTDEANEAIETLSSLRWLYEQDVTRSGAPWPMMLSTTSPMSFTAPASLISSSPGLEAISPSHPHKVTPRRKTAPPIVVTGGASSSNLSREKSNDDGATSHIEAGP